MNNKLTFIGADNKYKESNICIFGAPMDTTTTNRPGTRFGPNQARLESYGLETYSPYLDKDLEDINICDYGDIDLVFGDSKKQLNQITKLTKKILNDNKIPFMVGGEHLVTLGAINAYDEEIHILQFDAHCDLRKDYMGVKLSHSTVMQHCYNNDNVKSLTQLGIRSGTKEEFEFAKNSTTMEKFDVATIDDVIKNLKNKKVYVTIDLDVLDPSIFPGTGTPEPGGITFKELQNCIIKLKNLNIIGCDVVELSPNLDPTGVSNAVCAKVIREMLLILGEKNG